SPAPREREGPNPKGWEGEGRASVARETLTRLAFARHPLPRCGRGVNSPSAPLAARPPAALARLGADAGFLLLGARRDLPQRGDDVGELRLGARLVAVERRLHRREMLRRGAAAAADDAGAGVARHPGIGGHQRRRPVIADLAVDIVGDAA